MAGTKKLLDALTDESLEQAVSEGHRNIGRIAWHIVQTLPEMCNRTGLAAVGPGEKDPVPSGAAEIAEAFQKASQSVLDEVTSKWNDEGLFKTDEMYGESWPRGLTLKILHDHEIHHRGQLTVLMRQAGLKVPGMVGPSLEEWEQYGMPAPEI